MAVGIPLGPYRLVRRLASGGMAEIFLARQEGKDGFARDLVVKRILPHLAADPEFTRMFRDEARLAAQLSHPNVVHVYDFGSEPDDDGEVLWLAMELVRGVDLRALIVRAVEEARERGDENALPPHHAAKIVSFVCEALAHAHSLRQDGKPAGVVHRDVTPSNVLVSFDGAVKLADFGIAKARAGGKGREATEHGVVKGKLAYLSPEQARGDHVDARSDLFNVGILLFESILGEPLFPHDDFRRAKMLSAAGRIPDPERIDRVPPALARVIKRALAPRREDRYPDALSLRADLETYLRAGAEPSDTVELGRYVRHHFPDVLEEDARAPRAAGTVASSSRSGTQSLPPSTPPSGPPPGTHPIVEDAARTIVARPPSVALAHAAAPPPRAPPPSVGLALEAAPPPRPPAHPALPPPPPPQRAGAAAPSPDVTAPTRALERAASARARNRIAAAVAVAVLALASVAGVLLVVTAPATPEPPTLPPSAPPPLPRTATLPVEPAELLVTSDPPGHELFVDARPVGATPAVLTLAPGPHRVEVRDDRGALLASELVSLDAAEVRELAMQVTPQPALATLRVDSSPAGATVRIDGDEAGATPLIAEVLPARHRVDVDLDGYLSAGNEVVLEHPGEQATLAFALTRAPAPPDRRPGGGRRGSGAGRAPSAASGTLTIATTPWSEVYLGSRHLGTTPLANVSLPAGDHVLTLRSPGRGPRRTPVTIRPGETTRVRLAL